MYRKLLVALLAGIPWISLAACSDAAARAGFEETPEVAEAGAAAKPDPPAPVLPRDRAPKQIRGLYLTAYTVGSAKRRPELLDLAKRTEINTFVFDLKTENGIHFRSEMPLAQELEQAGHVPIRDLKALVDTLHAHDLYAIGRIVVFKDPVLSKARPAWSIQNPRGGTWKDKAGYTWVSAWDPAVWEYNLDIAEEAARAGVDEIQFDYVRFPEQYRSLPTQVHPHARGDRTEAIRGFLTEARKRLQPHGVVIGADVFGLSMNESKDVGIGQQWEAISSVTDHILPMVYPSHYFPTHLRGVPRPNRMPYETVYNSVGMGVIRNARMEKQGVRPARIIPWLQAFDAPWVDRDFPYGPEQIQAQIRAVHDLGLEDWIFWDPHVRYERVAAGFAPQTEARARPFNAPRDLVTTVDRFERERAVAARTPAAEPVIRETVRPQRTARKPAAKPKPKPSPKSAPQGPRLLGVPVTPSPVQDSLQSTGPT